MIWFRPSHRLVGKLGILLIVGLALIGGCGGKPQLMPTPHLYSKYDIKPFADVPPELQNNRVEVIYVTDRALEKDSTPEAPVYGHKRSRSVAFGVATVQFGEDVTWDQLVEASTSAKRKVKLGMDVVKTTELRRFPPTPKTLVELPGPPTSAPAQAPAPTTAPSTLRATVDEDIEAFQQELSARLAKTPVKEVYIFVHGVKTDFEGAVMTIAEIWHFLGRQGVPIAYTWPAGGRGLLRGYTYDYNSSEFTVFHLKTMLRVIAENPDVKKVNLLAHSRGTDALVTAVRELHLEIAGSGRSTRDVLKLDTCVLAAPDLDIDVVVQRMATARLGRIPKQAVVYVCPDDEALGFSRLIFGGMRLGKLQPDVFTPQELEAVRRSHNPALVNAVVTKPGAFGHNYFYSNPAVSSDLILLLRYHLLPGAENGRPLGIDKGGFWTIDDKYPRSVEKLKSMQTPTTRPGESQSAQSGSER